MFIHTANYINIYFDETIMVLRLLVCINLNYTGIFSYLLFRFLVSSNPYYMNLLVI